MIRGHYVRRTPATPDMMRRPLSRHAIVTASLLVAALLSSGCVYRPDIQQGNLLLPSDIDQVTVGMSRSQVRYLLGTPMVSDPFAPERWDYVYRMTHGRSTTVDTAHIVVRFDGDKVSAIERLEAPAPPSKKPTKSWRFWQKSADELAPAAAEGPVAPPPLPDTASPTPPT
jgi:outer membrane protein assembly factor BamE